MKKILLATGPLSWFRAERVSDRYGSVSFWDENSEQQTIYNGSKVFTEDLEKHVGQKGKLLCEVLENRESTHIGDFFHAFFPSKPEIGEKVELGEGTLFVEYQEGKEKIGLSPNNGRQTFWLKPKKLYRVHEQTVNLFFIPNENIN
jgi:hypothetical protein